MARRFAKIVGRHVVLLHRIVTRGGDVYDEGEVMRVRGAWRSGVHLEPLARGPLEDPRRGVRHVPRTAVRVLEGARDA